MQGLAASGTQGRAPYSPSLPRVPWHLDRLDQATLPLDGLFQANVYGTGVNVYILSSVRHSLCSVELPGPLNFFLKTPPASLRG